MIPRLLLPCDELIFIVAKICNDFFSFSSREERRWIEKQNKAARKDRKKEEMSRIRQLVGKIQKVPLRQIRSFDTC